LAMQSQSTGGLDGFGRRRCLIDGIDQRQATAEQAGAEGFGSGGGVGTALTEKEFKVLAEVEDPEALLVAAGPE
jgi:hypothetical protein